MYFPGENTQRQTPIAAGVWKEGGKRADSCGSYGPGRADISQALLLQLMFRLLTEKEAVLGCSPRVFCPLFILHK